MVIAFSREYASNACAGCFLETDEIGYVIFEPPTP
jgi:hypothetical protein